MTSLARAVRRNLLISMALLVGFAASGAAAGSVRPTPIVVNSALGGQILGYDIDQNGTEGVLSEYVTLSHGFQLIIAIETFDQTTGKIIKIEKKIKSYGDFVTLGVVGNSVGLVEYQHAKKGTGVTKLTFDTLNPLGGNKITGHWTPKVGNHDLIVGVSESQGYATTAVLAFNTGPYVFGSDVANNVSGPKIPIKGYQFDYGFGPVMALDTKTNDAVVASGPGDARWLVAIVDLATSQVTQFRGVGFGKIAGIAVDAADDLACTTPDIAKVAFTNLNTHKSFEVSIPGATYLQSGADVQFDPINKLFLVLQPNSSQGGGGSAMLVYDPKGNLVEVIKDLGSAQNLVISGHIALNPGTRSGFLQSSASQLTSFSY